MPSLQHAVASRVIPVLRRNMSPDDIPAMRAALTRNNRAAQEGPPKDVRRTHEETISNVHGFPVFTLWRSGAETSGPTVLYLHGGAYVKPSDARHYRFATRLADALGGRAVLPAYPLAPEFTVEDSFEEMIGVFDDVASKSPGGVVLAGDSAGGGYALALAEALRDRGGAQPDRLVLIAPWVDLTGTTPGVLEAAESDPWLSHPHLNIYASMWAGTDDPDQARRAAGQPGSRRPRRPAADPDALRDPRPAAAGMRCAVRAGGGGRLADGVRRGARPDPRLPAAAHPGGARGVRAGRALLPARVNPSARETGHFKTTA